MFTGTNQGVSTRSISESSEGRREVGRDTQGMRKGQCQDTSICFRLILMFTNKTIISIPVSLYVPVR